eukprot:454730-Rhodomonas_salina.2
MVDGRSSRVDGHRLWGYQCGGGRVAVLADVGRLEEKINSRRTGTVRMAVINLVDQEQSRFRGEED